MDRSEKVAWGLAAIAIGVGVFLALRHGRQTVTQVIQAGDVIVPPFVMPDILAGLDPSLYGIFTGDGSSFVSSWNPCGCGCDSGDGQVSGNTVLPETLKALAGGDGGKGDLTRSQVQWYFSEVPSGKLN